MQKPPPPPSPPPEIPDPVKRYLEYIRVNVTGPIERTRIGEKEYYVIPVLDEATKRVVRMIYPPPPTGFKMTFIQSKRNRRVAVYTFKEEPEPFKAPPEEEVEKVAEEVRKVEEPKDLPKPPEVDWRKMREMVRRLKNWVSSMERAARNRQLLPLFSYLTSILELGSMFYFIVLGIGREVKPVYKKEEIEELWRYVVRRLDAHGVPAELYRDEFDAFIGSLRVPIEDAVYFIDDFVSRMATEYKLRRRGYTAKRPRRIRFSWRLIEWGLGDMRVSLMNMQDAVRRKDYSTLAYFSSSFISTAEKLLDIVQEKVRK